MKNELEQVKTDRDALAALVQEMRDRLDYTLAYIEERDDWEDREAIIADVTNELAAPDTSAAILARRDAAVWREAADLCEAIGSKEMRFVGSFVQGTDACEFTLRAKAAELLKGLEKEHG